MRSSSYECDKWKYFSSMGAISQFDSGSKTDCKRAVSECSSTFEGAIGAIDCTHVAILASREHEEAYINHNGYHSLNVQMVLIAIIYQFIVL